MFQKNHGSQCSARRSPNACVNDGPAHFPNDEREPKLLRVIVGPCVAAPGAGADSGGPRVGGGGPRMSRSRGWYGPPLSRRGDRDRSRDAIAP